MEYFQLVMFYDETGVKKDSKHDIVTIKKERGKEIIALLLRNKKTIIYK